MVINSNSSIISVIGGKGGVGKSVFAANLAAASAIELRTPCLLIDFDSKSCGDQNFITGFQKPKTINELNTFTGTINTRNLGAVINIHSQVPLHYLAAIKNPGEIFIPNISVTVKQLQTLSNFYKYIYIDLGNNIDDLQSKVLELSTLILTVTTPEILTLNQTLASSQRAYGCHHSPADGTTGCQ